MAEAIRDSSEPFDEEAHVWGVSPRMAGALFALPPIGLLLVLVDLVHGDVGTRLLAEDSLIEWATALAILATAAFATVLGRRLWRDGTRAQAVVYLLLAVAAVLAAGEEISWGQRVLGIETPASIREENQQGELTFHNLDAVYEPYVAGMLLLGLYGSVGPWFVYRFKRWQTANWYLFMPPIFLSSAFIQLAAYRIFRYTGSSGHNYGEWCELCVAAAIAIFVALNVRRLRPEL